jgi:hypothetical protein
VQVGSAWHTHIRVESEITWLSSPVPGASLVFDVHVWALTSSTDLHVNIVTADYTLLSHDDGNYNPLGRLAQLVESDGY